MKKSIKISSIIMMIAGTLIAALGAISKIKGNASISIIGGADGPTSIFVAGSLGDGWFEGSILIGAVLVVLGALLYYKKRK